QDVGLARSKFTEDLEQRLAARGVPIQASDPDPGQIGRERDFDALGPRRAVLEFAASTAATLLGRALDVPAQMTHQAVAPEVIGHRRGRAVGALLKRTAGLARERGRVAPAIEEQDRLLARGDGL